MSLKSRHCSPERNTPIVRPSLEHLWMFLFLVPSVPESVRFLCSCLVFPVSLRSLGALQPKGREQPQGAQKSKTVRERPTFGAHKIAICQGESSDSIVKCEKWENKESVRASGFRPAGCFSPAFLHFCGRDGTVGCNGPAMAEQRGSGGRGEWGRKREGDFGENFVSPYQCRTCQRNAFCTWICHTLAKFDVT